MKIKINLSSILAQLLLLLFVIVWIAPTFGLFISSFRDKDQLAISGWWTSLITTQINEIYRTKGKNEQIKDDGFYIIKGNLFNNIEGKKVIILGRSNIVGKPLSFLLTNKNATVTLAHSKSKNLKDL